MGQFIDLTGQKFGEFTVIKDSGKRTCGGVRWLCTNSSGALKEISSRDLRSGTKSKEIIIRGEPRRSLIGNRYGWLLVENYTNKRKNDGSIVWSCRCDCGKYHEAGTNFLIFGSVRSCGCKNNENRGRNLTGQRFGKLTVLEKSKERATNGIIWICKCDCGKYKKISTHNLTANLKSTKSCGCLAIASHWSGYKEITGTFMSRVRAGARNRGLEYNITIEYLWNLFIEQDRRCVFTDQILIFSGFSELQTASIDRIDSLKGYIEGNVQWVHKDINQMKMDRSDKEFINWCKLVFLKRG